MSIDYGKLGLNISQSVLSNPNNIVRTGVDTLANTFNMPSYNIGYGQTPIIPLDFKLAQWNRYIILLTQSLMGMAQISGNTNMVNDVKSFSMKFEEFIDKIDFPLSSRLIMFRPKDAINVNWIFPVLVLPVNPDTFKVEYKKRSELVYTLGGFVVTHWHDDAITITASGYIPSFRNKAKILSESYQYFLQFLNLYLSCGKVQREYTKFEKALSLDSRKLLEGQLKENTAMGASEALNASKISKELQIVTQTIQNSIIELRYQQDVYEGIFLNFTVDENYEYPNTLQYSFTFKAMHRKDVVFGSLSENKNPIDELFGSVTGTINKAMNSDVRGLFGGK